jgi:hypothetical protein
MYPVIRLIVKDTSLAPIKLMSILVGLIPRPPKFANIIDEVWYYAIGTV